MIQSIEITNLLRSSSPDMHCQPKASINTNASNTSNSSIDTQAMDLRRYHGLHFVTSSLEKKAEAAAMKEKLDQDSTHVPAAASVVAKSNPQNTEEPEQKHPIRSSVAYGIAASAASYVQSHARGLLCHGAQPQQEGECADSSSTGNQPVEDRDRPVEDCERSQRVYKKSEVAAYVAASTMTAVVAAGEKEKQEAARDLQSLHSAPCEWFVCDDVSTYTRCFVIQVNNSFVIHCILYALEHSPNIVL